MRKITLILTLLVVAPMLRAAEVLPFIENDYGKAVARAKTKSPADEARGRADRLANEGKNADAAKEYEHALDTAPKGWRPYGRASEGLMMALTMTQQNERCAERADELVPRLRGTLSGANVAAYGL